MKIRSLTVKQFKKFTKPTRLDGIGDGLNIVGGPNEMGKSTMLDALRAVLFENYSSKAQSIQALQNDRNQAAPVVKLVFELEGGDHQIIKRFIKNPYARLSCPDGRALEGDAAEDELRDLLRFQPPGKRGAKPETLGMWNVLWVQQGESFGAIELSPSARSSLRRALASEVGAVLGGRRGSELPKRIEGQLGQLITPDRKQPRGAYKKLIDRVETIAGEHRKRVERRQELSETLDKLESAQKELARLSAGDQDRDDQAKISEARRHHNERAKLEERIKAAATERDLKKLEVERATQAAEERRRLTGRIEADEAALATSESRLTQLRDRKRELQSTVDTMREEVRQQEKMVTKAEEASSFLHRVLVVANRQAEIRNLEARYERARDAETRQHEALRVAKAIRVTDAVMRDLRKAEKARDTAQGRVSAEETRIRFDMTEDGIAGIDVNGQALTSGQHDMQSVEPVTITVPDRGRITIEPGTSNREKILRDLRDAETKRAKALEEAGATSIDEADDQRAGRQKALRDAEFAGKEVELHAPATDDREGGAQALANHIEGLCRILKEDMDALDLEVLPTREEAEAELAQAQAQAGDVRGARDTKQAELRGPESALDNLNTETGTLRGRHDESTERLQRLQNQLREAREGRSDDVLCSDIEATRTALAQQESVVADLEKQRGGESVEQLQARIERLERAVGDRRDKCVRLKEQIASHKSRVDVFGSEGPDEAVGNLERTLEQAMSEKQRQGREVEVLGLLLSTLQDAERKAKEQYLLPVVERVRPYLRGLFPGADIHIDEDLRISGVTREARYPEDFNRLSMGTQEQIAVLVRLAFAELLAEKGHPATIVLDDALVFSDDHRMEQVFDILNMAAKHVQVIMFTCREQLFEGLGARQLSLEEVADDELASA